MCATVHMAMYGYKRQHEYTVFYPGMGPSAAARHGDHDQAAHAKPAAPEETETEDS